MAAAANAIADAAYHASVALAAGTPTAFSTKFAAGASTTGSDQSGSNIGRRRFFFGGSVSGRSDHSILKAQSQRGASSSSVLVDPASDGAITDGLDRCRSTPSATGSFSRYAAFLPSARGGTNEADYGVRGTDEDPGYNATHVQRSKSSRGRSWRSVFPSCDGGCCNASYGFSDGTDTNDAGGTPGFPAAAKRRGRAEEPSPGGSQGPSVMRGSNQRARSSGDLGGKWSDGESWRSGSSGDGLRRSNSARAAAAESGARMWTNGGDHDPDRVASRSRPGKSLEIPPFELESAPPSSLAIVGPASRSRSTEMSRSRKGRAARAPDGPGADAGAGAGVGEASVDGRPVRGRRTSFPTNSVATVLTEQRSSKTFGTRRASRSRQRRSRSVGGLPADDFEKESPRFVQTTEHTPALCPCSPGSSVADSSMASWTVQGGGTSALYSRSS